MVTRLPNNELQRLLRVHDARYLHMGIDATELKEQIELRQAARDQEAEIDRKAAALRDAQTAFSEACSAQQHLHERKALEALQDYRRSFQGLDKSRDWGLNRPDRLCIDCPARLGDDDPRCGHSTLQKFAGEGLLSAACQQEALQANRRQWVLQQEENTSKAGIQAAEQKLHAAKVRELDNYQNQVMARERDHATQDKFATAAINEELGKRLKVIRDEKAAAAKEASQREVQAMYASRFLAESIPALHATQPHRIRTSEYKGMSQEERQGIRQAQRQQLEEKIAQEAHEKAQENACTTLQTAAATMLQRELLQAKIARKMQDVAVGNYQQKQSEEKCARDTGLRQLYTNIVTPDYFAQFEASHR